RKAHEGTPSSLLWTLGLGWFLFITGFFLGGIPWYVGTLVLLCVQMDYREKPGLVACTVASIIAVIAVTLGVTNKAHDW
ncbi:60S ribosomal protein L18a-like protein, partial [Prosopis cineraria]|uniref:60S ribosomal protein L18a-like protein n=1 Tax=Prosopis cineraria TaxID=364024 RepID=UPI002410845B